MAFERSIEREPVDDPGRVVGDKNARAFPRYVLKAANVKLQIQ